MIHKASLGVIPPSRLASPYKMVVLKASFSACTLLPCKLPINAGNISIDSTVDIAFLHCLIIFLPPNKINLWFYNNLIVKICQ